LGFLVIALLLLSITGVIVVKFYGEDLQDYVVDQVNLRLDSKVYVEEASVNVFHKFPNTSILLKEVTIWSSHNFNTREFDGMGADTLLHAETVSVSFNLFGLIRKKYNIRQLEIKQGQLHLFTDQSGEGNYKMVANKDAGEGEEQQINISQLRVSDFRFLLNNQVKQMLTMGWVEQLDINGKLSTHNPHIKGSLKGSLEKISNKGILYASDREVSIRTNLDVKDSLFTIKSGQVEVDRVLADVDGQFRSRSGTGIELNLYAAARDLEIHEVLDLLPSEMSNQLQQIRGNGNLQLYVRVTGMASSILTPQIEADFQTTNANLLWKERFPFTLKNLNLSGTYSNGGEFNPVTTSLQIESLSANIGADHLSGRGRIHNFYDPDFSFELKGDIHPEQWIQWYESIPVHQATGAVASDIKVSGSYDRLQPRGQRFLSFDISGGIALEDVMVRITENTVPFTGLNGTVVIDNDFWEPSFSGAFGESDFSISGSGLNLLSFLIDREESLVASATFRSNRMDLQEILDQIPGSDAKHLPDDDPEKKSSISFPDRLNLRLGFIINEFSKNRFEAQNVRGTIQYESPLLYIDSLIMQTMEGTLRGRLGMAQNMEGAIFTNVDASLYNLDIQQLFYAFNSFGQTQLTHEHLKGSITGTSVFSSDFDSTFTIQTPSILSESNITILDGELNGYSPIMALSSFIEVEELQNISFETLENTIVIRENQINIPVMDIQSNALNLSASGTHGFDNRYDYRLKLKLSELLYSKARKSRSSEFEIATDEEDTRTLFLKVFNEGSGVSVEMDRERTAQKIREDMREEKAELKKILNRELGLFKRQKSDTINAEQTEESEVKFQFEFTDEPEGDSLQKQPRAKGKWWKKRTKKDTVQNKPVHQFVIDDEPQ